MKEAMPVNESVKHLFDAAADGYDRQRRQLIPCFDDFYGVALSMAESASPAPAVLDLGAGTGLFSGMVRRKYPSARLTLVDLSENMLAKARERFGASDGIRYVVGDYVNMDFEETYDIVISSLSIHHLSHGDKRRLYATVFGLLRDGGIFVNADQAAGRQAETDRLFNERWLAHINGSGLSRDEIEAAIERRKLDNNAPLSDQLRWLEEAGFREADCVYKYMEFVVLYARK